jgi:hypothetical protein
LREGLMAPEQIENLSEYIKTSRTLVEYRQAWDAFFEVRSLALKELETVRSTGLFKHPLEAAARVAVRENWKNCTAWQRWMQLARAAGQEPAELFAQALGVSHATLTTPEAGLDGAPLLIEATHAPGVKCARCWQWFVGSADAVICQRCERVLSRPSH